MTVKPFIYAHELLSNGGGVWLGCDSEEITRTAHIDGETGEEVIALYHVADYDALLSLNAELLEALEYALPYLEACVPSPRNGINPDCSVDVNCVDRARAAIAKSRSQS
ncbi:hypothetical protein [Leptolyngbya phage Lbo-JY16]